MQRLIIFLLFLVFSVWAGLEIVRHPGYLLLVYHHWLVQMPLWFALLGLVIIFLIFYLLIDSLDRLQFFWYKLKSWLRFHREHKAYSKTQHGLTLLIENRWKKAEKLLITGVDQSFEPLMNYLGAARAAHEQKAYDRRDKYIQKAYHVAPNENLAIGLTQAELELSQDQFEHAAATLNNLRQLSPYHPRILQLCERIYTRLADWKNLLDLLPFLRKAKIITPEQQEQFSKNIYCELLRAANHTSLENLHQLWQTIPKRTKKNPEVVSAYINQLLQFSATANEIEELIRGVLKHDWQADLVKIYGTFTFTNLNRQLVIVGAWMRMYGPHPELLALLGKFCSQLKLWGKAKDYLEQCLKLGPHAEAALEYGKLLEQLDDQAAALQQYREGLVKLTE